MIFTGFTLKSGSPFLFAEWDLTTVPGLILALLGATALAVLKEGLTFYIQLRESLIPNKDGKYAFKPNIGAHCLLSAVHMIRLLSGYLLMMCIMSYNVWMLTTVTLGGGIGYLCTRPIINACFFKYTGTYNVTDHVRTDLLPRQPRSSQDYFPMGLYFNTSDPWSNSTDKQNSVCEQEFTMYVSVL